MQKIQLVHIDPQKKILIDISNENYKFSSNIDYFNELRKICNCNNYFQFVLRLIKL